MPEHHIPRGTLHEDIVQLKREHEEVVSIHLDPNDDTRYLVVTKYCGDVETRPAS